LKIAMITPWKVRCGIFTYTENLCDALGKLGAEIYIVRLPRFGGKTTDLLRLLVRKIPVDKVDLIHVQHEYGLYQNLEGGFYGDLKPLGKPLITTMHAVGNWTTDSVLDSTSDRVIVHNEFCAKRFSGFSYIIPHGSKPEECAPAEESKKRLGIPPKARIVGYVGFISRTKGLEQMIKAMKMVPKAALLIGGGWHAGPEGAATSYIMNLKQWSLSLLQGRCQWLDYVPDERLPIVYGAMDIVVYPSRFATESGALIMALSHGKAVIASNIGPFREKKKQEALITFTSEKNLAMKIKKVLADDELKARLEKGARDYANRTTWGKIAKRHLSLYEDAVTT